MNGVARVSHHPLKMDDFEPEMASLRKRHAAAREEEYRCSRCAKNLGFEHPKENGKIKNVLCGDRDSAHIAPVIKAERPCSDFAEKNQW